MDCRTVRTLATGRLRQQLPPEVQSHLAICEACRDELENLPSALVAPSLAIPPPDLASRIMERLPAMTPGEIARQKRVRRRRRRVLIGLLSVLGIMMLYIGLLGLFVDSAIPASLVGGIGNPLGRLLLALTLAAKPMASALTLLPIPLLLASMVAAICVAGLWLRLLEPPTPLTVEVQP